MNLTISRELSGSEKVSFHTAWDADP